MLQADWTVYVLSLRSLRTYSHCVFTPAEEACDGGGVYEPLYYAGPALSFPGIAKLWRSFYGLRLQNRHLRCYLGRKQLAQVARRLNWHSGAGLDERK